MKHLLAAFLSIGLFSGLCFAGDKPELKNLKDKESYSLGYQVGQTLKIQGLEIDPDLYASGLRDALGGTTPAMTPEEIQRTIAEVQKRTLAARQKELKEKGEKNRTESQAFMVANKAKEGVITLPSGLQYKILQEGSGKTPKASDEVTVNYTGFLLDGTEFDSSSKRGEPGSFRVDKVIPGWTEALQLMKEGSRWQLFVPPQLGYGERNAGAIPPNSVLVFEVELLAVK